MRKLYLAATLALMASVTSAQQALTLSTYNGTDIAKYAGQEYRVTINRYLVNGWNTIALPIDMSEAELNETFGEDCRLECLVAAESVGDNVQLDFADCKAEGLRAGAPYILYYSGEDGTRAIRKNALVQDYSPVTVVAKGSGDVVSMHSVGHLMSGEGVYGILARDNDEAKFVKLEDAAGKYLFYATRCYIDLGTGRDVKLLTNHLDRKSSSIQTLSGEASLVDVYNLAGHKVASGITEAEVGNLKPGTYVINGQKVIVK